MKSFYSLSVTSLGLFLALLTGCSASFAPAPETPGETALGAIGGTVYGGQQPITGATITAYETSISGYGAASTSLATTTTDSKGYFSIPASTTCATGRVVYLYSLGGNPGSGVNTAAGLMAVLGTCPADGLLVNAITTGSSAQIYINEVSTVAAAFALSGFATSATAIGNSGTALANTGIQNAAANASQMYTAVASGDGGINNNGSTRAALATTPNGNGTVPQAKLDTLANILAACVNSTGPTSTACSNSSATKGLFYYATSNGTTSGTAPTNTATAAIYIAQNPLANVTALYNVVGSTANPFNPALTAAPHDYTVEISFTGGGLVATGYNTERMLAVDGSGNIWAISEESSVLSKFSPLGVPANASGYAEGFGSPLGMAIDSSGNIWVVDQASDGNLGSAYKINSSGTKLATYTNSGNQVLGPRDIAFDYSGNAWIGQFNHLLELSSSGTFIQNLNDNGLSNPWGVAVEAGSGGNIWIAEDGGSYTEAFTDSGGIVTGSPFMNTSYAANSNAIDSSGSIWIANSNNTVSKLNTSGAPINGSPIDTGGSYVNGIAIDGNGDAWVTDATANVRELSNTGMVLSTTAGFTPSATAVPQGIVVDGSGNVWYDTSNDNTLREMIGAATPVAMPIIYGVINNKLGSRP